MARVKQAKVPIKFWKQSKELSKKMGQANGSAVDGMRIMSKLLSGELTATQIKKKGRGKKEIIIK